MQQIEKNNVSAENQLAGAGLVTFENPNGKGVRVLFVGNSITRHAPSPAIGWARDCGMAATAVEKDYVHLLMQKYRKTDPDAVFCVCQVADWERNYRTGSETYPLFAAARNFRADIIFFRFIENCPRKEFDGEVFKREYAAFIDYLNPTGKAKVVLSSGFWKHEGDGVIWTVGVERGYPFVDLGDLGESDEMKAIGLFEHTGVANHPGDCGMEAIAERLWNALGRESNL